MKKYRPLLRVATRFTPAAKPSFAAPRMI